MKTNYLQKQLVASAVVIFTLIQLHAAGNLSVSVYNYSNPATCGTVNLEADPLGQKGNVTYVWKLSNGTILRNVKNSYGYDSFNPSFDSTTTFHVYVTDDSGQKANALVKVNLVWGSIGISSNADNSTSLCPGENLIANFLDYDYPNQIISSYLWKFDDATSITGKSSITKSFSTTGKHMYSLEIKNACGLDTMLKDSVIINNKIRFATETIGENFLNDVCPGQIDRFSFYYNGDNALKSYSWKFGDGASSTLQNTSHIYSKPARDTVTLTLTNYCNIDTILIDTIRVKVLKHLPATNSLSIYGNHYICPGDNLSFSISGYFDTTYISGYKWNLGDGTTATSPTIFNHTYTKAGNYPISVILYDYCGFSDTMRDVVHVKSNLQFPSNSYLSTSYSDVYVGVLRQYNYSIFLSDTMSVASQKWYFGDGDSSSSASPNHIYSACKAETLRLVTSNYCGYTLATQNYFTTSDTSYSYGASPYFTTFQHKGCQNEILPFSAYPNGMGVNSYKWIFGDNDTVITSSTNILHAYKNAGKYIVSVIISGYCGTIKTIKDTVKIGSSSIFEDGTVAINSYNQPQCKNDNYSFTVSSSVNLKSYLWSFDDGTKLNGTFINHIFKTAGKHAIALNLTDFCNNDTTLHDTISLITNFSYFTGATINVSNNAYCPKTDIDFSVSSGYHTKVNYSYGPSNWEANRYDWNFGDGYKSTSYSNGISHNYKNIGIYPISVKVTNGCGFDTIINDTMNIKNNIRVGYINLNYGSTYLCPGQPESFSVSGNGESYQWNFGDTIINGNNVSHAFSKPGTYNIQMTATNSCGFDSTLSVTIDVSNKASLGNYGFKMESNNYGCFGDSITWMVDYAKSYVWDFGDKTTSNKVNSKYGNYFIKHKYASPGTYDVKLTETDMCGVSHVFTDEVNINSSPGIAQNTESLGIFFETNDSICANRDVSMAYSSFEPINIVNFGDGSALYSGKNPIDAFKHRYSSAGDYELKLNQMNSCGDTIISSSFITVQTCLLPLSANFNYNLSMNAVSFASPGSDHATSWYWNFGDNAVTNGQYAVHSYQKIGSYTVCLYTGDNKGDTANYCQVIKIDTVACNAIADYSAYTSNVYTFTEVFTDKTTGNVSNWYWDFGDGSTSTLENPVHNYAKAGNYTVSLSISDNHNNCYDIKTQTIQVGNVACEANFTYSIASQTVIFANTSTGTLYTYYWDFGDGNYSTAINPTHKFLNLGTYEVSLTVANKDSCMDKKSFVISLGTVGCDAGFSYYVDSITNTVYLKENNISTTTNEMWTFGDGMVSNNQGPSHQFSKPGFYTVSLSVYNSINNCIDYIEKVVPIGSEGADCQADFIYQVDSAKHIVNFTDASLGNIKTYSWNFGDNVKLPLSKTSVKNPSYTYATGGYYNVCHLVVNKKGISNIACKVLGVSTNNNNGCQSNFDFSVDAQTKTAYFKDVSLGNPDKWNWNFNDSKGATDQNPTHAFTKAGYFLVSLQITNSINNCSDKTYKLLNVGMPSSNLAAGFGYDPQKYNTKADGYPVDFEGAGVGDHARLRWTFGDSTIDTTTTTPTHVYNNSGTYPVCYKISDPVTGQLDSVCQNVQTTLADVPAVNLVLSDVMVFPNPISEKTYIKFNIRENTDIRIYLVDISGRKVATIMNEPKSIRKLYNYLGCFGHRKRKLHFATANKIGSKKYNVN